MENGINDIVSHINKMYLHFNKKLEAELPKNIVFTVIPNRGKGTILGWFAKERWQMGDEVLHEINITADKLARTFEEIAETLLHEMVHLKNNINGIDDCTQTQYHKKAFKHQAEEFGLNVERTKNRGYSHTSLGEEGLRMVKEYLEKELNGENPFTICRLVPLMITKNSDKRHIAIDRDIAEELEEKSGEKLGVMVRGFIDKYLMTVENEEVPVAAKKIKE
jgi:hypothetical protein